MECGDGHAIPEGKHFAPLLQACWDQKDPDDGELRRESNHSRHIVIV